MISLAGPLFLCTMKGGRPKQGGGKGCHWSIWEQLSEGDGQGSCHQDVWQTPDEPH